MEPKLLTVPEAAEHLRMSAWTVYDLCREGTIPSIKIGERRVRVPAAELDAWIQANVTGAAEK